MPPVTMARLKTTSDTLEMLDRGLIGYSCQDHGPCYLLLSDGSSVKVSVVGTGVAWKFECYSLALEIEAAPQGSIVPFVTPPGATVTSVLLREEYNAPYSGDPRMFVGQGPTLQQAAAKPGNVPAAATMSCLVAYGVMIGEIKNRLVVVADWLPFNIVVTTDEVTISDFLSESEIIEISDYIQRYGFS